MQTLRSIKEPYFVSRKAEEVLVLVNDLNLMNQRNTRIHGPSSKIY